MDGTQEPTYIIIMMKETSSKMRFILSNHHSKFRIGYDHNDSYENNYVNVSCSHHLDSKARKSVYYYSSRKKKNY